MKDTPPMTNASIKIENNLIVYHSSHPSHERDSSWILPIDEIKVVGVMNRMIGDDDSLIFNFIDQNLGFHFLTTTHHIEGYSSLENSLNSHLNLEIGHWTCQTVENPIVIYPEELWLKRLYGKDGISQLFQRFFGEYHAGWGELSSEVRNYIWESIP
ncbi:MAG: hypothetical protein AAGI38_19805 [Bacteroidota bacterium]